MVTTTDILRVVEGRKVPAPGTWFIDPVHSEVGLTATHLVVSKVRGRLTGVAGAIVIDTVPERSSGEVSVDATTIETGDAKRDQHLRSPEFLDVERFSVIRFVSSSVAPMTPYTNLDVGNWQVEGDLTVRDVTRRILLELEVGGVVIDPWGKVRTGMRAWTEVDRDQFGITWNQALEAGGFLVGKSLTVDVQIEAVRQDDA